MFYKTLITKWSFDKYDNKVDKVSEQSLSLRGDVPGTLVGALSMIETVSECIVRTFWKFQVTIAHNMKYGMRTVA